MPPKKKKPLDINVDDQEDEADEATTRQCPMSADMMKARAEARRRKGRKGPEKGRTTSASLPRRATPPVCVVENQIARSLNDDGDITEFCMEMEKYNAQHVHV